MNIQSVTSTISSRNQTAVPSPIRRRLKMEPGDKLVWQINQTTGEAKVFALPKNWGSYMRGLGKEIWQKTNTRSYIKNLRKDR